MLISLHAMGWMLGDGQKVHIDVVFVTILPRFKTQLYMITPYSLHSSPASKSFSAK